MKKNRPLTAGSSCYARTTNWPPSPPPTAWRRWVAKLSGAKLLPLLDPALSPARLSAVARLLAVCGDKALTAPLEAFIRALIETVTGTEAVEAFTNLIDALRALDNRRGARVAQVADTVFWTRREEATFRRYFPWRKMDSHISLGSEDYGALLAAGDDDARAAIIELQAYGGGILQTANTNYPTKLDAAARGQLRTLAEAEQELEWQCKLALAAVKVNAVELLPWILQLAEKPEMAEEQDDYLLPKLRSNYRTYLDRHPPRHRLPGAGVGE